MRALRMLAATTVLVISAGSVSAAAGHSQVSSTRIEDDVTVRKDRAGRVHSVAADPTDPVARPGGLSRAASPATVARAHLASYATLFGVRDHAKELVQFDTERLPGGQQVIRYRQRIGGHPVIAGELAVSMDSSGNLHAITGEIGSPPADSEARIVPAAAARSAVAAVAKATDRAASRLVATVPELSVFDPALLGIRDPFGSRLVWRIEVRAKRGLDVDWFVLVDARSGAIALSFDQLPHAKSRLVCDLKNIRTTVWLCDESGSPVPVARAEGDPPTGQADVDSAYELTGATYDFYSSVLGRDGIDGAGMPIVSSVRFCPPAPNPCPYPNAFWVSTDQQVVFGAGFAAADDVVAHELTHGVTQHTSRLLYYYQSGAINESISDVMGELLDQWHVTASDTPSTKWLLGEDLPIGAVRSMSNPPAFGDPDSTASTRWNPDPLDAGGVHINSGVGNKAAHLMTDGGSFGGETVTGLGITKAANIWHGAQALLTSGADYADLANALKQSCANLAAAGAAGVTLADCDEVQDAVDAVKMSVWPATEPTLPQAKVCASSQGVRSTFFDDFNRAAGPALGTGWTAAAGGSVAISDEYQESTAAGNSLFVPDPLDTNHSPSVVYVETSNWIKVWSVRTFLHFRHAYAFDWLPGSGTTPDTAYDGGRVLVDVEGDAKGWVALSPGTNGYNFTLDGTTTQVYGGDSRGWQSSKASLASYAGNRIKIRFEVRTDGIPAISAAYGWWLDDVRVYTCTSTVRPVLPIPVRPLPL